MAFKDIRRDYENYKKRGVRVSISNPDVKNNTNNLIVFQLPENVYVTRVLVDVIKADSTTGSTIDIVAVPAVPQPKWADFESSTTVLADEIAVDSTGLKVCDTCNIMKLEGNWIIAARDGDVAGAGDGYFAVVIEYIEYTNTADELTRIPNYEEEIIME